MKASLICLFTVLLACGGTAAAAGPSSVSPGSDTASAAEPRKDKTIVIINGHKILDSDVEKRFQWLLQSFGSKKLSDKQIRFYRTYTRYRLIDMLVQAEVFAQEFQKRGLTITEADRKKQLDLIVDQTLRSHNWTMEDYKKNVIQKGASSLEERYQQLMADPSFTESIRANRLLDLEYPGWDTFTAKQVKDYYREHLDSEFTEKASVRARHILFKTQGLSEEEAEQARLQAMEVLEKAKQPGADFAALAKQYSQGPSAANGGDVGYFVRQTGPRKLGERLMLPAFTEVAFALEPGEISHLVKTSIGYHIIQVTDKKPARQLSFDEVRGRIEIRLWQKKRKELLDQLFNTLSRQCQIEWIEKMPEKRGRPAR